MIFSIPHLCFLLILICRTALANTEILNLIASEETDVGSLTSAWPMLDSARNEQKWSLHPASLTTITESKYTSDSERTPCPHELSVTLELDSEKWRHYSKFTLRLSWPASSPAGVSLEIHSPEEVLARFPRTTNHTVMPGQITRRKYARISLVDTAVRTPSASAHVDPEPVPFILVLEPLYLGVLPASVLPILLFLVPIASLSALAIPRINTYFSRLSTEARRELVDANRSAEAKEE